MSTTQSERLRGLVEPLVSAEQLELEEIEVSRAGRRRVLRIVVDSDEGVELDACAELSRSISAKLDETDAMGEDEYVLEVSSPRGGRPPADGAPPLRTEHRPAGQADPARGRELVARILGVDENGLDLEVPGVKGRKPTARRIAFDEIAKARVELEFNRKDKKEEEA